MKLVSDLMKGAVGRSELLKTARAQIVLRHWPEVVGNPLSEKVLPDNFENGTLWVVASSSVWAQEVVLQKEIICARLNERAGEDLFQDIRTGRKRREKFTKPPGAQDSLTP